MSYFFGTTGISGSIKTSKRKHGKHRISSNNRNIERIHGSRHQRKHINSKNYILKPKSAFKEPRNSYNKDYIPTMKYQSRDYLDKATAKLDQKNCLLTTKLEETETGFDSLSGDKEKDESASKLRKKNQKLEKSYNEMQAELEKVNVTLSQKENEFKELRFHHEQTIVIIRNFEKERNNFISKIQILTNENSQLNEDVSLLKNLVFQLNIEIEKYQDKLRTSNQSITNQTDINIVDKVGVDYENKNILKSWGRVNLHALGPLLNAYQENVNEKNLLINNYKNEFDACTGRMKEILSENEDLHTEIKNLLEKYYKCVEEKKILEKDSLIVKEHNDLLIKQLVLQKQKIQEIHNLYKQKVESMSEDNNKLHKDYMTNKIELSNLKGKYEILNESYEKLKTKSEKTVPIFVHNAALDECKQLSEELKQQSESEKKNLNFRIKHLEETKLENEKQLKSLVKKCDQLKIHAGNSKKNLKRTQYKLECLHNTSHTIQISCDSYKYQLNKITSHYQKLIKEHKILVADRNKLIHILQEKEAIQYLETNITQRMETLQNQLKIVQKEAKEQLTSAQKHIKKQELSADQIKMEYERELQQLKQLLQQKEKVIQCLQREKYATQDNLELVWKAATSDDKKVKVELKNSSTYIL